MTLSCVTSCVASRHAAWGGVTARSGCLARRWVFHGLMRMGLRRTSAWHPCGLRPRMRVSAQAHVRFAPRADAVHREHLRARLLHPAGRVLYGDRRSHRSSCRADDEKPNSSLGSLVLGRSGGDRAHSVIYRHSHIGSAANLYRKHDLLIVRGRTSAMAAR